MTTNNGTTSTLSSASETTEAAVAAVVETETTPMVIPPPTNGNHTNHNHNITENESYHDMNNNISDSELTPPLSNRRKKRRGNSNHHSVVPSYGAVNDHEDHEEDHHSAAEDEQHVSLLLHKAGTMRTSNVNHGPSNSPTKGSRSTGSRWPRGAPTSTSTGLSSTLRSKTTTSSSSQQDRSQRSLREHRLNQWLECTIVVLIALIVTVSTGIYWYYNIHQKHVLKRRYQNAILTHAIAAEERRQQCHNIDWQTACDHLTNPAGARRRQRRQLIIEEPSHQTATTASKTSRASHHQQQQQAHHYGKKKLSHGMNQHRHRSNNHHRSRSYNSKTPHHDFVPNASIPIEVQEEELLQSDDPAVTYDNNCLKVYRLDINHGQMTFPYHSSQLLRLGGNHSMVLIIQHGALRNSEAYFCSFKQMMLQQPYRHFDDILIIAPDFNYATDDLVHPNDAVWNSSKPWGDWRVGAESDPYGVADMTLAENEDGTTITTATTKKKQRPRNSKNVFSQFLDHTVLRPTISSFDVLDHILAILTDKRLYPNVDKISFVGHSAGGQMVQRYAILSVLAALWFMDTGKGSIDIEFIIANPSSYTYLDPRRYPYNCGTCTCSIANCTCDEDCTLPDDTLQIPRRVDINHHHSERSKFPCYQWNYDRWPYGIGSFTDESDDGTMLHTVPYALRDGFVGVERATRMYRKLNMVYMVGQNDTCNDGLPTCSADCWKRTNYSEGEWPCFRNDMDTRCPAMLQGPYRRARGYRYMKYLEDLYGEPVHRLHTIPEVGHDATKMFSSDIALKELFN